MPTIGLALPVYSRIRMAKSARSPADNGKRAYLLVATVALQAVTSFILLQGQMKRRLDTQSAMGQAAGVNS